MALNQTELITESSTEVFPNQAQVSMNDQITAVFGTSAGEETLGYCQAVGYNETTGYYAQWMAPDPTVLEVDTGGATGGTWGLTIDGIAIANSTFANDASAALVAATILAETGVDATVALDAGVYTITFDADTQVANLPTVTGDVTQLTGGTDEAATATAGTASYGTHIIRGFVWPTKITLDDTNQVQGQVMVQGRIPYDAIADNEEAGDLTALQTELKRTPLGRGIIVEDLVNIH